MSTDDSRREYEAPEVTEHGSVERVTQEKTPGINDLPSATGNDVVAASQ